MKLQLQKGTTSKMVEIFVQDSSSTVGAGLTGLVHNTAGLTAYYYLNDAASATQITLATMTLGTYTSGGFIVVDATNMPGLYSLGLPNAALTGADSVVVYLQGASNMAPVVLEIELVDYDPNDAVRMGMTALPNAVADAAGGLPISDAGGLDLDTQLANTNEITVARMGALTDWLDGGRLDLILDARMPTTHLAATAGVLDEVATLTGHTAQTGDSFARIGLNGAGLTNINLPNQTMDIVGNITGNLSGSVGSVTGAVGSVTGAVGSVTAAVTVGTMNANVVTAASIAASALDGKGDWNVDKTGYSLSAAGIDAIFDEVYETSGTTTFRQYLRLAAAALWGKLSGAATTTITIQNEAESANRIVATVDADGNRSAVVLTKT